VAALLSLLRPTKLFSLNGGKSAKYYCRYLGTVICSIPDSIRTNYKYLFIGAKIASNRLIVLEIALFVFLGVLTINVLSIDS
jgi:hypothetical protein